MRILPVLLVLTATVALAGNGPEFPVDAPAPAEAPYAQSEPAVASNGSDFFAVWRDERSTRDTSGASTLYGARVDATGRFVPSYGIAIADNVYRSAIASNGHGYLLVYSAYLGTTSARQISDDGTIQQAAVSLGVGSYIVALASNGNGFVALTGDAGFQTFSLLFLDSAGAPVGAPISLGAMKDPSLVAAGNDYRVVDLQWTCDGQTPCVVDTRLTSISTASRSVIQTIIGPRVSQWTRVNAIATADRLFIVNLSDGSPETGPAQRTANLEIIGFDGQLIAGPRVIGTAPAACYCGAWRASLATDGTNVLVAWPRMRTDNGVESNSKLVGIRVSANGTPLDSTPFDVATSVSFEFAAATSRNATVLVTSEQRNALRSYDYGASDLFARTVRSLSELNGPRIEESMVESAAAQFDSAVATSGSRAIAVWRELDQPSAIRASVASIPDSKAVAAVTLASRSNVAVSAPSVAALGDFALTVWREDSDQGMRILAKRVGFDGIVRDGQPIIVAGNNAAFLPPGITSVASDGSQFLVVWNDDQDVFAARVLSDGTLLDQEWILVSRDETVPRYHFRVNPRVIWTGTSFLVTWGDDPRPPGLAISPPLPSQTIVRAARVSPSGAVLDVVESPVLVNALGPLADVVAAVNRDKVMLVWGGSDQSNPASLARCVQAMPLDANARPVSSTITQIDCDPFLNSSDIPLHPAIASKDDGFLVLWASSTKHQIFARLLSVSANPGAPFVVSPPAFDAWAPSAAGSPFGTVVTYDRIAPEPQYGGSPRVFGRVIDSIPLHKQRSARR